MEVSNNNLKGYILAITAAVCWGISGTFGQYLFQRKHINPEWLVTMRLLVSGFILIFSALFKKQVTVWNIWKNTKDRNQLLIFGIVGMLGVQYTFFVAIKFSNAATATILQYSGPVIIAAYLAVKNRRLPTKIEIAAIILAITGTFLLVTHGNYKSLSISGWALFWGISSAFTMAFYSIQPKLLLDKWEAGTVIGWGMITGGVAGSFLHAPWNFEGIWDIPVFLLISFIIIFATLGAFYAYLMSIKIIGATRASLLACTEPLSAVFLGVIWLKVPFGLFDWSGAFLIILTIYILSANKKSAPII